MNDTVKALEQELTERRDVLAEAQTTEAEARARARKDPDDLDAIDESVKAQARVNALKGRITDLEKEVAQARREGVTAAAEERLRKGLPRAFGSVDAEWRKDRERIERLEAELAEARSRIKARGGRKEELSFEASVLALRFGLDRPEHILATRYLIEHGELVITPAEDGESVEVRGASGTKTIRGDTGRIMAQAGPWKRSAEDAHRAMIARNAAVEADRQAARDRVDAWLRQYLQDDPAARDRIIAAAEEAGIPVHASSGDYGASLLAARDRLEVLPLETTDGTRTAFWALPDTPKDKLEGLRVYQGESRRSRQMASAMR